MKTKQKKTKEQQTVWSLMFSQQTLKIDLCTSNGKYVDSAANISGIKLARAPTLSLLGYLRIEQLGYK